MVSPGRRARLQIYVSSECVNCAEAHRLAREVAGRFPDVVVEVIDLAADVQNGQVPDVIVAVPTYLLDGRVVSLGNPYPEELFARLCETVG
jgi:predicted thioredoxin/glutaredoxin